MFATTDGDVVYDTTFGIVTAGSRARIDTFVVDAALLLGTVCAKNALRTAGAVRIADVIGRTDAIDGSILRFALSIGSARIGIAGPWWLFHVWLNYTQGI